MILIPRNLSKMATLTAKESTKFALTGVNLTVRGDGTYKVAASDSKIGGIIEGKARHNPDDFPVATDHLPKGKGQAMISAKDWKVGIGKPLSGRLAEAKPVIGETAVVIGDTVATFVGTDLERTETHQARTLEGRFPPIDEVVPKGKPAMAVKIDPEMLVKLLKVAQDIRPDGQAFVTLEIFRPDRPLVVRVENEHQNFTGLIMPLS